MRLAVPVVRPVSELMVGCLVNRLGLRCSAHCARKGSDTLSGMRSGSGFPTVVPGVVFSLDLTALTGV